MKKSKKLINKFLYFFLKRFFFSTLFNYYVFLRTFRIFKKKIYANKQTIKFSNNISEINNYEYKITSQNNEDGLIERIFQIIPHKKFFIEIGFGYYESNSLNLIKKGWKGKLFDANEDEVVALKTNLKYFFPQSDVKVFQKEITKKNINEIVNLDNQEKFIDFFSLDIDGNDYWVLKELDLNKIKIACCEYNNWLGSKKKIVMKYDENHRFVDNGEFGSSLLALCDLMKRKNFSLIAVDTSGTNAFFVNNQFSYLFKILSPEESFRSVNRFYDEDKKKKYLIILNIQIS